MFDQTNDVRITTITHIVYSSPITFYYYFTIVLIFGPIMSNFCLPSSVENYYNFSILSLYFTRSVQIVLIQTNSRRIV